ncbi:MAG: hypothetical protein R3325_16535 [Thermoanaerobaculia bacterium]|nr:hypothetical protein [Thermoanaerobaculia bacterium]
MSVSQFGRELDRHQMGRYLDLPEEGRTIVPGPWERRVPATLRRLTHRGAAEDDRPQGEPREPPTPDGAGREDAPPSRGG